MLLDFHLARGPIPAGEWVLGRLGGTPGWMSPEQEVALDAVRAGRPVPEAVDGRSDIHALGLLLREALWGTGRSRETGTDLGRQYRPPGVSVGLADILHKCLASKPSARYPDAAALADDLRRHLNDLPLRGVANRSPLERWHKRQRRLGSPARQALRFRALAGIAVALALAAAFYSQRVREIEANLEDGRRYRLEQKYPEAVRILGRGLERAAGVPGAGHLSRALTEQLVMAQRGQNAAVLHRRADLDRFRDGLAFLRSGQVEAAAEEFRRALERQPQDFWSNFYQGLCAYRLGNYEDACAAFRTCIALAPEAAECYYNRALAHEALGRSRPAFSDYGRALELDPGLTAAALNRGLLCYKAGRHRDAIADFQRALHTNPGREALGQIHYNLALAYLAAGDRPSARANSEKALNLGWGEARGLCDRLHHGS
jgi:tetratricopeptide (TPR) repeat protein